MKPLLLTLAFVAFVAALIVGARALDPGARPPAPAPAARAATERDERKPTLPALFVQRSQADTAPIALAGPRAKPMLLHLWASWCGPCVAELPGLLELGRAGAFDVVAVSVDDRWPDVVRFFGGADRVPREVVWDQKIQLEPALGVRSLPTTFLVDTQGRAVARFTGAQRWTEPDVAAGLLASLKQ